MMLSTTVVIVLITYTAPFLKLMGIKMGKEVTSNHEVPTISPKLRQMSITMQKVLCNYDEDGDGIDDRYQTDEYMKNSHSAEAKDASQQIMGGYGTWMKVAQKLVLRVHRRTRSQSQLIRRTIWWQAEGNDDPVSLKEKKRREIKAWTDEDNGGADAVDGGKMPPVTPVQNLEDSQDGK